MPTYKLERIPLTNLRLSLNNYRYPHQTSERNALATLAKEQGLKLVNLAESIAEAGLNPTDLPMVAPEEGVSSGGCATKAPCFDAASNAASMPSTSQYGRTTGSSVSRKGPRTPMLPIRQRSRPRTSKKRIT